ncbi:MAG: PQQ-binding-like beta-propeller repeat protein, partial [Verrucomicrobiota bacterium]
LRSGPYDAPEFEWGFASSPVIHGNNVILQCDVLNGGFITVLDLETGKERLRIPRDDVATWSTPLVHRNRIVCNGYREIGAYDLKTGKKIWWLKGGGDVPVPTPFIHRNLIFISSAHGRMNPIYAIHPDAVGDLTPDRKTPEGIAWWNPRRGSYIPTPIALDGRLYIGNDRGILSCMDALNGREIYRHRIAAGQGESYSASPVASGNNLFFTSEDGDIHVIEAGPEFKRLRTNSMKEVCMPTPAIDEGQIFIRTRTQIYCIGRP